MIRKTPPPTHTLQTRWLLFFVSSVGRCRRTYYRNRDASSKKSRKRGPESVSKAEQIKHLSSAAQQAAPRAAPALPAACHSVSRDTLARFDPPHCKNRQTPNDWAMPQPSVAADASDEADKLGIWAARQICRRHAPSFYLPSYFLNQSKRAAAHAVAAFCILTRQALDQPDQAEPRLKLYADRLSQIYKHELDLPLPQFRSPEQHALHAFAQTIQRFQIPHEYFHELAEGCRSDLMTRRYATWNSLQKHCRASGGIVALIMCAVMGLTSSGAAAQAISMGNGMRLTHILRDIAHDWDRGHVYLPLVDLVRFGYREKDLAARVVNDAFVELMKFEVARARELLRLGAEGICWLGDEGSRLAASAAAVHHINLLDAIQRQGYDVFTRPPTVSAAQKFRRLSAAWRLARRRHDEPLPAGIWGAP